MQLKKLNTEYRKNKDLVLLAFIHNYESIEFAHPSLLKDNKFQLELIQIMKNQFRF